MATFLETLGLLNYFSALFAALLVFAVVFALLSQTKILGTNKTIQAIIAIVLALLVLIYPDLVNLINFISPWFVILFVFLLLLLLTYRMFGLTEGNIADYVRNDRTVNWTILAIGIIILLAGLFSVFGQRALEGRAPTDSAGGNETLVADDGTSTNFESNLFDTLFNPKILGVLLVFAIAVFAIAFLGGTPSFDGGGHGGGGHGH